MNIKKLATTCLILCVAASALAQDDRFASVTIETVPVTGNISMLIGSGGNIGVSTGSDGLLIIDDQYWPLAAKIRAALSQLRSDTPKFLLNTHFHGDHTGGNADFGVASIIIAQKYLRGRLVAGDSPDSTLPVITFDEDVTVHFNGENITLIHMPRGHTDSR